MLAYTGFCGQINPTTLTYNMSDTKYNNIRKILHNVRERYRLVLYACFPSDLYMMQGYGSKRGCVRL